MKAPTPAQIKKALKWLQENLHDIPHYTVFGDDNHAEIEAEIEVLEKDLSEEDIYDRSHSEDETEEEAEDDSKDWTSAQRDSALDVRRWLDGDAKDGPIENWKSLVGVKVRDFPIPPPHYP